MILEENFRRFFASVVFICSYFSIISLVLVYTLKKMLGKYWTEHMLGCFQPTG